MTKIFDKLPQIVAGVSFMVLILAIVHEYAYFAVVGAQYQSLMSATDYLVSALSWMPLFAIVLFIVAIGALAFARLAQGRSHQDLISSSTSYKRVYSPLLDTFFGSSTAVILGVGVLLLGNPYRLGWAQSLISVGLVTSQDGDALRGGLADVEREVLAERSLHDLDPIAALEPWRLRQLDQSLAAADRRVIAIE